MACKRIMWHETVPENRTTAVIGSDQERNVCWGGALRDETKMAARETRKDRTA